MKKTKCVGNWILQGVIIFSLNQTQRGAIYKAFTSYHQRFWKWGKWEISFKSKIIILYKSIKYSYFWSFSGYGEENKMFWKLNFTANMMIFHQLEPSVGWNYQMMGNSLFSLFYDSSFQEVLWNRHTDTWTHTLTMLTSLSDQIFQWNIR